MIIANKSLGQNFLKDKYYLDLISSACTQYDLDIIEIGCGTGSLTEHILQKTQKNVFGIEIDGRMQIFLDSLVERYSNFQYVISDFFKLPMDYSNKLVCGNLPYNCGSKVILTLLDNPPNAIVLMLQKEVVQKIAAKCNAAEYSGISVLIQSLYDIKVIANVPPSAFTPQPSIQSQVILCRRNQNKVNIAVLSDLLRKSFSCRRKIIKNTLYPFWNECTNFIDIYSRPQTIPVEKYIEMSGIYSC